MNGSAISSTSRLPELDGLRATAILLVLLSHHLAAIPIDSIHRVIEMGWMGVDLFFVLSGFLIGGILLDQRLAANYYRVFYLRRFFRIVPLYALLVIPGLLVLGLGLQSHFAGHSLADQSTVGLVLCAFFLQNVGSIFNIGLPAYLGPTWSVAVEEQFYLLLPPLVRHINPRRLFKILVGAILFAPLLRSILIFTFGAKVADLCYILLPCRWDSLLLGVICAIQFRNPAFRDWLASRWQAWRIGWCLLAGASLALLFCSQGRLDPKLVTVGYTVIDAWFACTLMLAVMNPTGRVHRILSQPILKPIATISYGLYLLQSPVAAVVEAVVRHAHFNYPPIGWTATGVAMISLGLTVMAATVSWKFYESRMIRRGHQFRYAPDKR